MATFSYRVHETANRFLMLFLHGSAEPDDAAWSASMADIERLFARPDVARPALSFLVITDGGAPSTTQRKLLATVTRQGQYPVAVVSTNPLIRGVVTAISWVNPGIKSFAPLRWGEAVAYAGFAGAEAQLLDVMQQLQRDLGAKVGCLAAVSNGQTARA